MAQPARSLTCETLTRAARRDAEMAGGYDRLADRMEDLELKVPARKPQR